MTNQKLAKAVLSRMNTVVDVANDGVEACEMFEATPHAWDVILMARAGKHLLCSAAPPPCASRVHEAMRHRNTVKSPCFPFLPSASVLRRISSCLE